MTDAAYDAIAAWYDQYLEGPIYEEIVRPAVFNLAGDVQGQEVLDLACGQGLITRELARHGARVTGVDLSARLLELARGYEQREPLGIRYVHDDAQRLSTFGSGVFAGAICNLALMDIPDLTATVQAVRRVLKQGGWFVFSITHPCFEVPRGRWVEAEDGAVAREVRGYFTEGFWRSDNPDGVRGKVGAQHRMLSTYLNALAGARFALERIVEPQATGRRAEQVPGNREVPTILVVRERAL